MEEKTDKIREYSDDEILKALLEAGNDTALPVKLTDDETRDILGKEKAEESGPVVVETPEVPAQPETEVDSVTEKIANEILKKQEEFYRRISGKSKTERRLITMGMQNPQSPGGESKIGTTRKNKSQSKKARIQSKKSRKINRKK